MQDPYGNPYGTSPFVHPNAIPNFAMRICQNKPRARRLLPLVRSDDLGIEAGEVLVDLVLGVVCGFLR
jgi:hypothetical protein